MNRESSGGASGDAASAQPGPTRSTARVVRAPTMFVYGLGDHTVNFALSSLQFFFAFFLVEVAGLKPALAGLVPLVGRAVDAFTDPAMGRVSDRTRWRAGRRRPYLLIGMVPFGIAFAALWIDPGDLSQGAKFSYFASVYVLFSVASTILAVPYLSLIPEMTTGYDERTSMNAWRAALAISGTLLAVTTMLPLVEAFGDGSAGWAAANRVYAVWIIVPWVAVWAVTFERPEAAPATREPFFAGVVSLFEHSSYRWLTSLYILSRIALDLTTAMFLFYFTYWLAREEDFGITMGMFLITVVCVLPVWLQVAKRFDKRAIFMAGAAWWVVACAVIYAAQPEWPRWMLFVLAVVAGAGYAASDLMPWSMLGEVVDEDELRSGQRREGIYYGFFTFLRKLGGALGVAGAFAVLDWVGFEKGQPQSEPVLQAIRLLTAAVPALLVLLAAAVAIGFPLSRVRHQEVLRALQARKDAAP